MKAQRLIEFRNKEEARRCRGKYVATTGFRDKLVMLDKKGEPIVNKDPLVVMEKAREMGCEHPVLIFCPDPKVKYLFLLAA